MSKKHFMLDLETLGKKPGCAILSIGITEFNPTLNVVHQPVYYEIYQPSCAEAGLTTDPETLAWWEKQPADAQALLCRTKISGYLLDGALHHISTVLDAYSDIDNRLIWANSPSFDCTILSAAYDACGIPTPWKFYNEQDCRTLVELGRSLGIDPKKDLPFTGIQHHAGDDATHQAKYINAIYQHIYTLQGAIAC